MAAVVRTALAAICLCTLAATAYLSASLMVLRPPRADYQQWMVMATLIAVQGGLTLVALRAASAKGLRLVVAVGGAAIAALGGSSVYSTVSGPHFEGYALVLGSALVVQGLLTLIAFAGLPGGAVAQPHA